MRASGAAAARLMFVTAPNQAEAAEIARVLVEERLAACVNLLAPIRSIYRWRDRVEDDREVMLLIKTRASLARRIERRVRELHSYEVPEIIAVRLDSGSAPYLAWLFESTGPAPRRAWRAGSHD
jgi:periplasmic divalent cation tolerance protein